MENIYRINGINLEKIWGSKLIDNKMIGEIIKFEVNKERSSTIIDSIGNSYNLFDLYDSPKRELLFGKKYSDKPAFPFLIKYICSNKKLSVQDHPKEKKETWLFLEDNGKVLAGLKHDMKKDEVNVDSLLNNANIIDVKKDDFLIVNPGTIHSIFENNVVCEVQNNYDVTYRYYDWDNSRKLTQEEFLANADLNQFDEKNYIQNFKEYTSEKFKIEKYDITDNLVFNNKNYCQVLLVLEGKGELIINGKSQSIKIDEAYFIIPNTSFTIRGNVNILLVS